MEQPKSMISVFIQHTVESMTNPSAIPKPMRKSNSGSSNGICQVLTNSWLIDRLNSDPSCFHYPRENYEAEGCAKMVKFLLEWISGTLMLTPTEYAYWLHAISQDNFDILRIR